MSAAVSAGHFQPRAMLITGGAGFIGSAYVRHVVRRHPDARVTVLDKLTYAGNVANLAGVLEGTGGAVRFVQGDIADAALVGELCAGSDAIINFAAETHRVARVLQVSTDEVYGHVPSGSSREADHLAPRSPYAASKAGGELIAGAYAATCDVPVFITRGSNTFEPRQYPEKMTPLFVTNLLQDQPVPVYGDGQQVRDWLAVEDHCAGIHHVLLHGTPGEAYNVGGGNEWTNLEVVHLLLRLLGKPESLIRRVADRPGHDRRYALDCRKLQALGWQLRQRFEEALAATVEWYRQNEEWWRAIRSGSFTGYYERTYSRRPGFTPAGSAMEQGQGQDRAEGEASA